MDDMVTLRFRFATEEGARAFLEGYSMLRRDSDPSCEEPEWDGNHWNVDIGPTDEDMGFAPLDIKDGIAICATYPY